MSFARTLFSYFEDTYENLESLPEFASAEEAVAGKNGIAFTPGDIYFCIAKHQNGSVKNSNSYPVVFSFGDSSFKMESYEYQGYTIGNQMPSASISKIYGSNNNENWTEVTMPDTRYWKYYKFLFVGSETNLYANMGLNYLNFTGTKYNRVEVNVNGELINGTSD